MLTQAFTATPTTLSFPLSSFSGSLDFSDIDFIEIVYDSTSGGLTDFIVTLIDTTMTVVPVTIIDPDENEEWGETTPVSGDCDGDVTISWGDIEATMSTPQTCTANTYGPVFHTYSSMNSDSTVMITATDSFATTAPVSHNVLKRASVFDGSGCVLSSASVTGVDLFEWTTAITLDLCLINDATLLTGVISNTSPVPTATVSGTGGSLTDLSGIDGAGGFSMTGFTPNAPGATTYTISWLGDNLYTAPDDTDLIINTIPTTKRPSVLSGGALVHPGDFDWTTAVNLNRRPMKR